MASRWLVVVVGASAVGAAAYIGHDPAAPTPPVAATSAPEPRPGGVAVHRLRAEIDNLRRDVAALGEGRPRAAVSPTTAEVAEAPSPEEAESQLQARLDRQAAALERAVADDPRDATWSPAAEQGIRDAFAKANFAGARLDHVNCTASLCRIEVRFDARAAGDEGMDAVLSTIAWDTDGIARWAPEDPRQLVVFAAREPGAWPLVE